MSPSTLRLTFGLSCRKQLEKKIQHDCRYPLSHISASTFLLFYLNWVGLHIMHSTQRISIYWTARLSAVFSFINKTEKLTVLWCEFTTLNIQWTAITVHKIRSHHSIHLKKVLFIIKWSCNFIRKTHTHYTLMWTTTISGRIILVNESVFIVDDGKYNTNTM